MIPAQEEVQIKLGILDLAAVGAVAFVAVLAALVIAKHL